MNYCIEVNGQFLDCPTGTTVLLAMKEQGLKCLPAGCCAGGCGICKVRVLEGTYDTKVMSRAQVSKEEEEQGIALACRILPSSDLKIERIKKQHK
jgi:ferredoxin